ncbi:GntR family transcriptional regulator [Shewanella youngdeokensis]|uniref:GntR family transcriptional regulator n=1 Tax=Shewanella youngdeokensis TaxID=2999068 RepID=A0ABZ0JVW0_9GAMM|nr:GntR family transcriptional regulator [Shewanella sp. DAU334]
MNISAPVVHKTRTQVVVEVLREKILSGEIAAGMPLRQSPLAEEMNVSRIPVREALLQLEAEGLVKFEAHKGASATTLSTTQVTELFDLRALIESDLLAKAIPNMTAVDISEAENTLDRLDVILQDKSKIEDWSGLNSQFHTRLYQAANRPHTIEVINSLHTNCDRYVRLQLILTSGIPKAQQDHRQLLKYCKRGDVGKATALLKNHILNAAEEIRALVGKQAG